VNARIQNIESRIKKGAKTAKSIAAPAAHAGFDTVNMNNEPMKSMNSRIGEPLAGAGTEFTSRTMNSGGWKVGKGGKVERKTRRFFPSFPTSSLLFPPFPTFSHLIFK